MAEQSDQERTHEPTGKRLESAFDSGDVPRSRELSATLVLGTGVIVLAVFGKSMAASLAGSIYGAVRDVHRPLDATLYTGMAHTYWSVVGPLLLSVVLVAIGGALLQQEGQLHLRTPSISFDRLNPLPRLGQLFDFKESGIAVLSSVVKMTILGVVCGVVLYDRLPPLLQHAPVSFGAGLSAAGSLLSSIVWRGLMTMLFLGVVDYFIGRHQRSERLKMTTQEVRDEAKDQQGDGRVRSKQRSKHAQMVQQRSVQHVPTADVVVVNPTHYAVALLYKAETMRAPTVVSKGADSWAERIRGVARKHGIPVITQPPLTRALFAQVEVGHPIPEELYQAVAVVLAHVYRIRKRGAPNRVGGHP